VPDTTVQSAARAGGIDLSSYRIFTPPDPFEDHIGPIYHRIEGDPQNADSVHCVLPTAAKMTNAGGVLHGGVLLTFADYALCLVAGRAADQGTNASFAMTVSLSAEFLAPGEIGVPVEARGEPLRVTGSLAFARGTVTQGGRALVAWSGTCRHIPRAKAMARKQANAANVSTKPTALSPFQVPSGYAPVLRSSPFTEHTGMQYFRRHDADGQVHVIQPTVPEHANSGGITHGGFLMTFADNALCTAIAATTGRAPYTVTLSAEFIGAGEIGPPLESVVEVVRATRTLGFTRGTVTQAGRVLLNYNAVAALKDWDGPSPVRA
jgi:uncharacterized protein (TIGR00369 family)